MDLLIFGWNIMASTDLCIYPYSVLGCYFFTATKRNKANHL